MMTFIQTANYLGYKSTDRLKDLPVKPKRLFGEDSSLRYDRFEVDEWLNGLGETCATGGEHPSPVTPEAELEVWRVSVGF